jgi:hypothetical protein
MVKKRCRLVEVAVGNVGTVYSGKNMRQARKIFREYKEISEIGSGRAGGEDVSLLCDGDEVEFHQGTQED